MRSSQPPTRAPVSGSRAANVLVGPSSLQSRAEFAWAARTVSSVERAGHQPKRRAVSSSSPATWAAASSSVCALRRMRSPRSSGTVATRSLCPPAAGGVEAVSGPDPVSGVARPRESLDPVGDFLGRLGGDVYEVLVRKRRGGEPPAVDPDGLLPVPVPAGPGLVHHAPPEFILVEDAQRGDHEVEVPEHAAQLPGALVLQVGDDDVREAVPRVVPQDERQVLEGKGLVFRIGGDASARVPELGDPAELEERRAEPAPKDGGDRQLAGAGSLCEKDERPHEQTLVTPDDRAISLTGPGRGRDGAGWPGVGGYGRPGLAGRRASRL